MHDSRLESNHIIVFLSSLCLASWCNQLSDARALNPHAVPIGGIPQTPPFLYYNFSNIYLIVRRQPILKKVDGTYPFLRLKVNNTN